MRVFSLFLFFCTCALLQAASQTFTPSIREFCGYIHKIYGNGVFVKFFSPQKHVDFSFSFDSLNQTFYWADTNLIMVFWGSYYPTGLDSLYHNVGWDKFYETTPNNKFKYHTFINPNDSRKYLYARTKRKIRFTGYSYDDYMPVESRYTKLSGFGIFSRFYTYPQNVKTPNKTYIVNYFYNKRCK